MDAKIQSVMLLGMGVVNLVYCQEIRICGKGRMVQIRESLRRGKGCEHEFPVDFVTL